MNKNDIQKLLHMTDAQWGKYAFSRDPINRRVDADARRKMIEKANACGREQACLLRSRLGAIAPAQYAQRLGLEVIRDPSTPDGQVLMFAKFNYPRKITLYMGCVEAAEGLIAKQGLGNQLENVDVQSVLLAHEMFHYIESLDQSLYTQSEKVVLWSIGRFQYKSGLIALGEIAAMAFAKELLGLSYNPYVFDVLLLWPHGEQRAQKLYTQIRAHKGEGIHG